MPTLQEEIERVAKLRGVKIGDVAVQLHLSRRLSQNEVRSVFWIPRNCREEDFWIFDQLPLRSREILRSLPLPVYAPTYLQLLERMMDEEALLEAVQAEAAEIMKGLCRMEYGPDHPQAQ